MNIAAGTFLANLVVGFLFFKLYGLVKLQRGMLSLTKTTI